ncbi:hypothetical protein SKAU_G00023570 [Synaphobranchus kaupii]|uniref:Uncharacterized protein n=1 Tax=Synaphobranchus kaupii TaxID=118154 RepID=A0A9Q1GDP3_SYNKA|nr:hypothetical protein SKAU_G00023570 [Synaphobranchus kaupii]
MRSTRLMQQLLEGIRAAFPASHSGALQRIFRLGKPGETGEEFPPVSVAAAYDDQRDLGNSLLNPETPQLGDFQETGRCARLRRPGKTCESPNSLCPTEFAYRRSDYRQAI